MLNHAISGADSGMPIRKYLKFIITRKYN